MKPIPMNVVLGTALAISSLGLVHCGGHSSSPTVAANRPPVFTSTPPTTAQAGTPYTYTPTASDPDGDTVSITLVSGSNPLGSAFSGGVYSWTPTAAQAGTPQNLTLSASDGKGGTVTQAWTVTPAAAPPQAAALSGTAAAGSPVAGVVNVKDAAGHSASSTIDASGHYSLDVTTMTAPFILWATGTVNGHSASMYSTATSAGTINISPITNLILTTALKATPDAAYAVWNGTQLTSAQVNTAKTQVEANLAPLFAGTGVPTGTDPMTTAFTANHTGLDAALDLLSISYANGAATVTNTGTGSSYRVYLADPTSATGFPATDATPTQGALTDLQAINAVWAPFTKLFATTIPTAQQVQSAFGGYLATGFLSDGENASQWLADTPNATGFTITSALQAPITVSGFNRAYLTSVTYTLGSHSESHPMQFVLDGTTWKLYGDQQWIYAGINAIAQENVDLNGGVNVQTGLQVELRDNTGFANSHGALSAIVTGPGFGSGLVLSSQYPNTQFSVQNNGNLFFISDDKVIGTIPDHAVYTVSLYSKPGTSVSPSDTPLASFTTQGTAAPVLNSALNATLFPTLVAPTGHTMSSLSIPGQTKVSWTNPSGGAAVNYVQIMWNGGQVSTDVNGGTSAILDASTFTGSAPTSAWLWMTSEDALGRQFALQWAY